MKKICSAILTLALMMTLCAVLGISASAATLPSGYTEVEYITATGSAYIDSGLYATSETEIAAKFCHRQASRYFYGANSDGNTASLTAYTTGNWRLMNAAKGVPAMEEGVVYETVQNASGVAVDGVLTYTYGTKPTAGIKTPSTFLIGNTRKTDDSISYESFFEGDIYYFRVKEAGELVRDYVPCYRNSDEMAGLYDLVEGKFYASEGKRDFVYPGQDKYMAHADAAIVVNGDTGEIYHVQDIDFRHGMASTTKVMTCILTIENMDLNDRTLPGDARDIAAGGSTMHLVEGEQLTIWDALHGLMLPSGNDAAYLLGRTVAGSYSAFVDMMNAKAAELGMTNTHYNSPAGGEYTTVYDYAKLGAYCMQNEIFRQVVGTLHYTIEAEPEYGVVRHELTDTNELLPGNPYEYEGCIGIKTGTTAGAGACLLACAERDGVTLFSMILGANQNDGNRNRFTESTLLLDYGFQKAAEQPYTVTAEGNTLTIYNPVTGYTVTAVLSAKDAVYTGEPIEAAEVETTYSSGTWNPYWNISYENNTEVGTATATLSYGGKSVSCNFEITDNSRTFTGDETHDSLVIPEGVTYDLGGHTLTIENGLAVNSGAVIKNGVLKIKDGAIVTLGDNGGFVPVYTGAADGYKSYRLYAISMKAGKNAAHFADSAKYTFGYKYDDFAAYLASVAANADGDLKVGANLKLSELSGDYVYSAESIAKMADVTSAADAFYRVNLNVKGSNEMLTSILLSPLVKVKPLGFRYVGEPTGEKYPLEYVAKIGEEKFTSLEAAVAAAAAKGENTDVTLLSSIEFKRPVTLDLGKYVRIVAPSGCNFTISGDLTIVGAVTNHHMLSVDGALALDGVTLRDHTNTDTSSYGAIRVGGYGTLTLNNATVENLKALRGAIYTNGTSNAAVIRATDTIFRNNTSTSFGGALGVYGAGDITLERCTFEGNTGTTYGGAIGVYGGSATGAIVLTAADCTFDGNKTTGSGYGGAIALNNAGADVTISNSTLTNNTVPSANGGAISCNAVGTLTLDGVTMSGNTVAGAANDVRLTSGALAVKGTVAIEAISLAAGKTVALNDTMALADPAAPIMIDGSIGQFVLSGSKVADYHDLFIGAVEGISVTDMGLLVGEVNYVAETGGVKYEHLADAVAAAKLTGADADVYIISSENFTVPTELALGDTVRLYVDKGMAVTLAGELTVTGGSSARHLMYVDGDLTLDGVTVKDHTNTSTSLYGAIRVGGGGSLALKDAAVENLAAARGAIYLNGSSAVVNFTATGTTFTGNHSVKAYGGAISSYAVVNMTLSDCDFEDNTADYYGGAIGMYAGAVSSGCTLNMTDCTFTNNHAMDTRTANYFGGGALFIYGEDTKATAEDCTFTGSTANFNAAAIYIKGSDVTLDGCTVKDSVGGRNGAIFVNGGKLTLTGTQIINNTATNTTGTGVYVYSGGSIVAENSKLTGNHKTSPTLAQTDLYYAGTGTATFKGENYVDAVTIYGSGKKLTATGTVTGYIGIMNPTTGTVVLGGTGVADSFEAFHVIESGSGMESETRAIDATGTVVALGE